MGYKEVEKTIIERILYCDSCNSKNEFGKKYYVCHHCGNHFCEDCKDKHLTRYIPDEPFLYCDSCLPKIEGLLRVKDQLKQELRKINSEIFEMCRND